MSQPLDGRCLCGACTFKAVPVSMTMGACHCGMCRRWSGGVFLSVDCETSVVFATESPLGRYRGSAWGERVFCKECGSTLMWQTQQGQAQHVSVQAFDNPEAFTFDSQIFIDRKPSTYAFSASTKEVTEAEFMAMFT